MQRGKIISPAHKTISLFMATVFVLTTVMPPKTALAWQRRPSPDLNTEKIAPQSDIGKLAGELQELTQKVPAETKDKIRLYFELKQGMISAVDKGDKDTFSRLFEEMSILVGPLRRAVLSLEDKPLFDIWNEIAGSGRIHPEYLGVITSEGKLGVSLTTLRRELTSFGEAEFTPQMQGFIAACVDEVVRQFYKDPAEREHWRARIANAIKPKHWENLFPADLLEGDFESKREVLLGMLTDLPKMAASQGAEIPDLKHIVANSFDNELDAWFVLPHEILHYLMDVGQFKAPPGREDLTWTLSLHELIEHGKGGDKNLAQYADKFGPAVQELYDRGAEIYKSGETGFMIFPGLVHRVGRIRWKEHVSYATWACICKPKFFSSLISTGISR